MSLLSILLWAPSLAIKAVLIVMGLVMVPLTSNTHPIWGNNEHPEAPKWSNPTWPNWARQYWWRAIRNPSNNIRYLIDEPAIEERRGVANCDEAVRDEGHKSAWRWVRSGLFSEFWYMRKMGDEYFEFRIGWKFSGVAGFSPTIQMRKGG